MYLQVGLSRSLTAMRLGFSKSTLSRTIKRDPEFRLRVLQAEAAYQSNRTLCLLKAANKSWRAGAWLFKHYHPHLSTRRLNRQAEAKYATEAVEQISQALQPPRKAG